MIMSQSPNKNPELPWLATLHARYHMSMPGELCILTPQGEDNGSKGSSVLGNFFPHCPMSFFLWLILICSLSMQQTVPMNIVAFSEFCESFQQIIEPEGVITNNFQIYNLLVRSVGGSQDLQIMSETRAIVWRTLPLTCGNQCEHQAVSELK